MQLCNDIHDEGDELALKPLSKDEFDGIENLLTRTWQEIAIER